MWETHSSHDSMRGIHVDAISAGGRVHETLLTVSCDDGRSARAGATPDEARAAMMRAGRTEELADEILELMSHPPQPTTTVRDVTGQEPSTYATWVREHRAEFA